MRIGLDIDGAWAAGFWDGEGSVGCYYRRDRPSWRIACGISQRDARVLRRFCKIVGVGRVGGPYIVRDKPMFAWYARNYEDALAVFTRLRPYLDKIKMKQFEQALKKYTSVPHRRRACA